MNRRRRNPDEVPAPRLRVWTRRELTVLGGIIAASAAVVALAGVGLWYLL